MFSNVDPGLPCSNTNNTTEDEEMKSKWKCHNGLCFIVVSDVSISIQEDSRKRTDMHTCQQAHSMGTTATRPLQLFDWKIKYNELYNIYVCTVTCHNTTHIYSKKQQQLNGKKK